MCQEFNFNAVCGNKNLLISKVFLVNPPKCFAADAISSVADGSSLYVSSKCLTAVVKQIARPSVFF
eukprot:m.1003175 g.1003175  ORF g.1003175 m.1003175 type:complete len:66 (-) comp24041_c0_seq3:35-232(-)